MTNCISTSFYAMMRKLYLYVFVAVLLLEFGGESIAEVITFLGVSIFLIESAHSIDKLGEDVGYENIGRYLRKQLKTIFLVTFGVGESANQLRKERRVEKICNERPMIIKVRGVKIELAHISAECNQGKPPFAEDTPCILGALGYDDNFRMFRVVYSAQDEGWLLRDRLGIQPNQFGQKPLRHLRDDDYWIPEDHFEEAIQNAYIRATSNSGC